MKNKKIDEKRLREIQMKQSKGGMMGPGRGPGRRFGGLKEKPKDAKKTLKNLVKYIVFFKKFFIIFIITILVSTIASLLVNVYLEKIIESFGEYDIEKSIWSKMPSEANFKNCFLMLIILYLTISISDYLCSLCGNLISVYTAKKMRDDVFSKLVYLPVKYSDRNAHGDLMSRITNDVGNISNSISSTLSSLLSGVITIIGCLAIMIYYSPLLTLVSLISLVLTLIVTFLMSKYMRPLFLNQQKLLGLLNSQTEEMVSGCKTVIAYNHQEIAEEDFNDFSNEYTRVGLKAQIIGGSMGPMMNFIGNIGYFVVAFVGALFIIKGIGNTLLGAPLSAAIVIMFLTTSKQFTRPINQIAQLYSQLLTALAGAERVFELIDETPESFDGKVKLDLDTMKGTISFEHVNFSYVPEKQVINDFNLDVYAGHKIALVGATGSGKTTMVNLLMRFYDVNLGVIKVDNIDINDYSKKELREAVSIVLQDAMLFSDTIENNIKYGKDDATHEEIMKALEAANCLKFVNQLPDKEKTVLTEGATNISQGQRQLLTIARAILADPKILILDEATSSVDTRTEKKIQDALVNLMKNRTSIIIAHRLSTIQDADLIVVMDKGHVVEMGNHKELIELNGVYNRLYQTQFMGLNT